MAGSTQTRSRINKKELTPALEPGSLTSTNPIAEASKHGFGKVRDMLYTMCNTAAEKPMPRYQAHTASLDRWLLDVMSREKTGFLSAFVDQASMIASNLAYRLVGSKSLVERTLQLLRSSEGGEGFRRLIKITALNFYCSNFGGAVYLLRSDPVQASYLPNGDLWYWNVPPVVRMYGTDPTNFRPTGDFVFPFEYGGDPWSRYDFLRTVSMPSTELKTWGVGRCALMRCITIARMTSAVYEHVFNVVSPDTAKGIVTIKGMTADEFLDAMNGSEAVNEQDNTHRNGFAVNDELGEIVVLADRDEEIQVKFVMLARFPDNFYLDQWVRWTLTAFSTNLGYPLEEFIGMPASNLLGQSGAEVTAGVQRGQTKGGSEFINQFQEGLQDQAIPPSVLFEFSERDVANELAEVDITDKKVRMVIDLFEATQLAILNQGDQTQDTLLEARAAGDHIIDADEARRLLVEFAGLPGWITPSATDNITVDGKYSSVSQVRLRQMRDEVRDRQQLMHLANDPPSGEPVIQYENWIDKDKGLTHERTTVLWDDAAEMTRPTVWEGSPNSSGVWMKRGPNDWGGRQGKRVKLESALSSGHLVEINRMFRRTILAYWQNSDQPIGELFTRQDRENLVSRLYAIGQMGRDNTMGQRRLSDTQMAEMSGSLLAWARERTHRILSLDPARIVPADSAFTPSLANEMPRSLELVPLQEQVDALHDAVMDQAGSFQTSDWQQRIERGLEDGGRALAAKLATYETVRAFSVGQYVAAVALNLRTKVWTSADDEHGALDGEKVALQDTFSNDSFWPGEEAGCTCTVSVIP